MAVIHFLLFSLLGKICKPNKTVDLAFRPMSLYSDLDVELKDVLDDILIDLVNEYKDEADLSNHSTELSSSSSSSAVPSIDAGVSLGTDISQPSLPLARVIDVRKKRKDVKRQRLLRYKNVRTDVRDNYSKMFVNSMNTHNFNSMLQFCYHFFSPSVVCYVQRQLPDTTFVNNYHGPFWLANLLYTCVAMFPDTVVSLKSSKFHSTSANGAVTFTFEFKMTKLFNLPSVHELLPNLVIDRLPSGAIIDSSTASTGVVVETMEKVRGKLPQRKVPVRCCLEISIVMLTDPRNKLCTRMSAAIRDLVNDFSVESNSSSSSGGSSSSGFVGLDSSSCGGEGASSINSSSATTSSI